MSKNKKETLDFEIEQDSVNLDINIDKENRKEVASLLTKLLSSEYTLAIKTQKYHWNLYGPNFHSLHKFFDKQYSKLQDYVDLIAERIRALGFNAIGTLKEFIDNTEIKEIPGDIPNELGMINDLLKDYETIIRLMRFIIEKSAELEDQGTSSFMEDLIIKHEKAAWMLRAFLNENESKLDYKD